MSERLEAAKYLREIAGVLIEGDEEASFGSNEASDRVLAIADLIEAHDERVTDLLTYNNTMLDENRAQRVTIREQSVLIADQARLIAWLSHNLPELKEKGL
ncbi:MAG: hypothetical protein DI537_14565 [Stutzerimonas stutzeri]|nr:MAG: hypothetical protein DI537_14565 [Stutzerimonas stutzeri]